MKELRKFDVHLKSVPGFMAQYSGKVTVYAVDEDDAEEKAYDKLRRTSFPDRDRSCWRLEKVERVG